MLQPGAHKPNAAATTDGSTNYIRSYRAFTPSASFSHSVWFKTTTEVGGAIMGHSDAAGGPGTANHRALWMDNDGKLGFGVLVAEIDDPEDVEPQFVRSMARYNDGAWHHAVGTFDGTTISLYVDGVLAGSYARTAEDLEDTVVASVGRGFTRLGYLDLTAFYTVFGRNYDGETSPRSYFFAGSLDEASVHSVALSANQVAQLWQSGTTVLAS
jgi:hypothetical protein